MKKRTGFTLVELLIYMGLLTILMTILTRLFTATIDVQLSSEATGGIEEDSRYIYSRLAYDLSRADTFVVPEIPGSSANTLTIMVGPETYTYRLDGTNLILVNNTGEGVLNSYMTGISNITFTLLGSETGKKSIQVTYVITSTIQSSSGSVSRNITTTITER